MAWSANLAPPDRLVGRLHIVTDTRAGRDPIAVVRGALAAGASTIQVRVHDDATDRQAYQLASKIVELCTAQGASCLVNDRLHVALAVGATGGHVGADDLPVAAARQVLGPHAVLGATSRNPEDGQAHLAAGASYLGVGPTYPSSTKAGLPEALGVAGVAAVARTVNIPVLAIGGVTEEDVGELVAAGVYGVAVVSAVSDAADPQRATERLLRALGER